MTGGRNLRHSLRVSEWSKKVFTKFVIRSTCSFQRFPQASTTLLQLSVLLGVQLPCDWGRSVQGLQKYVEVYHVTQICFSARITSFLPNLFFCDLAHPLYQPVSTHTFSRRLVQYAFLVNKQLLSRFRCITVCHAGCSHMYQFLLYEFTALFS